MDEENEESINFRFKILEKIGSGGTAYVFKVKDLDTNIECAAKVLREIKCEYYEKEINILNELKQAKNPYICNIIESGEGLLIRKDKPQVSKKYFVLEYLQKGELLDYLDFPNQGLGELYSKFIFSKILNGVQSCHNLGICHRDIKLENILLSDEFSPKLCDFGFATHNAKNLTEYIGTRDYCAPEVFENKPYDGIRADIFSLGVVMMYLATNKQCFRYASPKESNYRYIVSGKLDKFWGRVDKQCNGTSKELKDLFIQMVSYKPGARPTIDEILKSAWMKEINDMDSEKLNQLESDLKKELEKRELIIKETKEKSFESKEQQDSDDFYNNNRGIGDENSKFNYSNIAKMLPPGKRLDNFIRLKGSFDALNFMNTLCNELTEKYDCYIEPSKKYLKFEISFTDEEDDNEEELTEEMIEEFKKLGINYENKNDEKKNDKIKKDDDISMKVKLFKVENKDWEYVLSFEKKEGRRIDFLDKVKKISDLIKKII